jgi:hypothetical protein
MVFRRWAKPDAAGKNERQLSALARAAHSIER